jgi:polyhydroxybutyrate depolymerase
MACLVLSALCPSLLRAECRASNSLTAGNHTLELDFGGRSRTFTVHVPPSYDGLTAVPLVFDLHGFSGSGPGQVMLSGFASVSDSNGFIVVAPTGYMNSWNGDIAYGGAYQAGIDDVGAIKAIAEHLQGIANIDRGKVYSTGLSNGAAMSNTLACKAADMLAAVAPVADPLDIGLATCQPARPISVLGFHGYDDQYVPYEGGAGFGPPLPTPFPSIPDTLAAWAKIMKCTGAPELVMFEGRNKCEIHRQCDGGAQVGYCSLEGSHVLYSQRNLDIADYAWKFFDQFSLPLPDADGDGIGDADDNCPAVANADQADANADCVGDACECAANTDCDGRMDAGAQPDAGTAVGNAGGSAAGGGGGAAPGGAAGNGAQSGGSGGGSVVAGGAAAPGAALPPAGLSGSGGGPAPETQSTSEAGCGCHALGTARSAAPSSLLLALLALGALLCRRGGAGRPALGRVLLPATGDAPDPPSVRATQEQLRRHHLVGHDLRNLREPEGMGPHLRVRRREGTATWCDVGVSRRAHQLTRFSSAAAHGRGRNRHRRSRWCICPPEPRRPRPARSYWEASTVLRSSDESSTRWCACTAPPPMCS